jgi:site-specific DNA recombinase
MTEANSNAKQKVAIYTRVSTEEQAREGVSIDAQLEALRAWGKIQGWQIIKEYTDEGHTGTNNDRPAFKNLVIDARQGEFSLVAVAKLDRFMRNVRLFHQVIDELSKLGVGFTSIQEGINTTDRSGTGRLFLAILAAFAEFESARIGERIAAGKRQRVSQGKWASGRVLYGYNWNAGKQAWEVVEDEATVVRYIYQLYVNEGLGSMKIPTRLNAEGYHTRTGSLWGFSSVNRILTHPAYKGEHTLGLRMPAIMDANTWELAQQKRSEGRSLRKESPKWLLQGLGVCGLCGHTLSCIQKRPKARRKYVCRGRHRDSHLDGSPTCTLQRIDAEWLEKAVWSKFSGAFNDPSILRESIKGSLEALKQRRSQLETGPRPIAEELEKVKAKKERLGLVFADGAISEAVYTRKLGELRKQEASLKHRIENLSPNDRAELAELERWMPTIERMLELHFTKTFVTSSGIYAVNESREGSISIVPLGFNLREKVVPEEGQLPIRTKEGVEAILATVPPMEFFELGHPEEVLTQNKRDILRAFGVKVYGFPDRVEIKGFIPEQIIQLTREQSNGGQDTQSDYR